MEWNDVCYKIIDIHKILERRPTKDWDAGDFLQSGELYENVEEIIKLSNKISQKQYYETFKTKHDEKIVCPECDGSYTYFAKSAHIKSKRHLNALRLIEKLKKDPIDKV